MFPQVLFHVLTNFMANFKRLLLNKRGGARDVNCLKLPGSYILLSRHIGLYKHLLRVLHSYLLTNLSLHHHWTISGFTFSLTTNKRDALVLILINFPWFRLTRASCRAGRGRGGMQPYSKSFISAPIIGSVPTQTCCKGFILIHSYHNLSVNNYSSWCHLNIVFVEHD